MSNCFKNLNRHPIFHVEELTSASDQLFTSDTEVPQILYVVKNNYNMSQPPGSGVAALAGTRGLTVTATNSGIVHRGGE